MLKHLFKKLESKSFSFIYDVFFFLPSLDLKESSVITQYLQIVPQVLSLSAFLGMTSMGKRTRILLSQ